MLLQDEQAKRTDARASPRTAKFIAVWNCQIPSQPSLRAALVLLILGLCLMRAYVGLWDLHVYAPDAFAALDGGWRVINGQRPHLDFYTALGPLSYLATAFGFVLARGTAAGLAYGQAAFGALVGLWAHGLARRRLQPLPMLAACLSVVLLSITPTVIGGAITALTPGTVYNRFGYALVALLLIEAVRPNRIERRGSEFRGGTSTGVALGLMLFDKVSFFLAGAFLLVALLPIRRQCLQRWYGIAAGAGAASLAFLAYLRFDVPAVLGDLTIAAHTKHVMLGGYLLYDVVICAAPFLICTALLSRSSGSNSSRWAILLAGASVCLTGFFLLMTSWQFYALPLNGLMAMLLVDRTVEEWPNQNTARPARLGLLLFLSFLMVTNGISDALSLNFALSQKLGGHLEELASFNSPALAGFTTTQRDYASFVNDGFALVKPYRRAGDTILSLDFTNPFSYSLAVKPALGGTPWLQYGSNFDETHGPSPERLFGAVTLVMVPKKFTDATLPGTIPQIYGPFLAKHFDLAGESAWWRLYRRTR